MLSTIRALALVSLVAMCPVHVGTFAADLTKEKVCYGVAYAHLDDQWQWTLKQTIEEFIPATLHDNFTYLQQYPEYVFNFEGAYRYWLAKKFGGPVPGTGYRANDWTTLVNYVKQGRWIPAGAFVTGCDVNVPSAEALIRQALYGQLFFMESFGVKSNDILLPDCFGFGYVLPTIAAHCGLKGFSTQKFDLWGGWMPSPFSIGRWTGVDGSTIVAALKPGEYTSGLDIRTADGDNLRSTTTSFADGPGGQAGIWATYDYVGCGDVGGAPDATGLVNRVRQNSSNTIKVYSVPSGKLYDDLTPQMVGALPSYDGELLMTTHGTGCYTSWAPMKYRNRRNEQRAALAEFACASGYFLTNGAFAYPQDTIRQAWFRTLALQMHDILTGTSIQDVYRIYAVPALDSTYADFNHALGLGNAAMANSAAQVLTTTATAPGRAPIVVVNSLAFPRVDVTEATVDFGSAVPAGVKVYDPQGVETPAQIIGTSGQKVTVAFVARVPAGSYSVYEAAATTAANPPGSALTIDGPNRVMENAYYKVTVNQSGDISSIIAKQAKQGGQELLSAPSRYELRNNPGSHYDAWEIQHFAVAATPTYVSGTPSITVQENGPARVSLKVTRTSGSSQFTQYIRLGAGQAGKRVDVYNEISWLTTNSLLKVGFPVTCANPNATWDLGIGVIQRPNMTEARYEVPGQQWADMTSTDGSYGLSILNDCKYGWNKESSGKINLTLLHSPSGTDFDYQKDQSSVPIIGIHKITYSFYGHSGDWTNGTVQQARCLNQPMYAFQAMPRAGSSGAREISVVGADTSQIDVMAIKKAEKSSQLVVRVRETMGRPITNASITLCRNVQSAVEMLGTEDSVLAQVPASRINGNKLAFSLSKFQPKTFAITLSGTAVDLGRHRSELRSIRRFRVVASAGMHSSVAILGFPANDMPLRITITDASGRLVKYFPADKTSRSGEIRWDGTDGNSRQVAGGLYVVECTGKATRAAAALMVVR